MSSEFQQTAGAALGIDAGRGTLRQRELGTNQRPQKTIDPTQRNTTQHGRILKFIPRVRWHRKLPTVITRSEKPTEEQPTAAREDNLFVCVHKKESQALLPVPGIVSLSRGWAAAQPHRAWESGEGKCPCLTLQ